MLTVFVTYHYFLGLKNLDIITDTLRRIKRNYGITVDIESVPVDDAQVYKKIFSAGNTGSVFQFESGGMRKMLKQFEPASMDDLILLVAAYRPGPLQYIPGVIKSKHGIEKPVYIANGLEEILSSTYGYTIYQEQVMEIFHKIAGLSLGEADIVRRAMAKKHLDELTDPKTNYHGKLVDGLCKNGATKDQAEQFWNELLSFASYAFNKSHAAAYAHVAYYTAWLKCHYPAEYMSSVMARTELNKLPEVLADSRQMGLKIKAPDINESDVDFVNIEDTIIFGFNNCKGVGNSGSAIVEERKANGKFSSIKNFVYRMSDNKQMNKSVYEALIKGGAFDEFCKGNRHSLLNGMEEFVALTKKLRAKQVETEQRKMAYDDAVASHASAKETKKRETALINSRKALETLQTNFEKHTFTTLGEDADRLSNEYEVLGIYVSGHPIDAYQAAIDKLKGVTPIARLSTSGKCSVCGIVAKATVLHRKSDNAPFLKFTLMDASGEITCMCWTKTYVTLKELLVNGEAVRINGKIISKDTGKDDETENIEIEISVESASRLKKPNNDIIMIRGTMSSWIANQKSIKAFADDEGCEGVFYDTTLCEFRNLKYRLSKKILSANFNGLSIIKKPLVKH